MTDDGKARMGGLTEIEILIDIAARLKAHIESEDVVLTRIERLLDGNGQPGLVRGHTLHDGRLLAIENWRVELAAAQESLRVSHRWVIGLTVTTALAMGSLLLHAWKG